MSRQNISIQTVDTLVSVLINGVFLLGAWQDTTNHLSVGLSSRVQRHNRPPYGSCTKIYPGKLDE